MLTASSKPPVEGRSKARRQASGTEVRLDDRPPSGRPGRQHQPANGQSGKDGDHGDPTQLWLMLTVSLCRDQAVAARRRPRWWSVAAND
jgi:hypothetical protein